MYSIRLMQPGDVPALEKLHAEQNERDGTSYPLLPIFGANGKQRSNTPLALVLLDGDEIRQGVACERTAELMLFGCDPKATATLRKQIEGVFYLLASRGYTGVHCLVPKRMSWWRRALYRILQYGEIRKPITRALEGAGFERDDHRLAHFYKGLEGCEQQR